MEIEMVHRIRASRACGAGRRRLAGAVSFAALPLAAALLGMGATGPVSAGTVDGWFRSQVQTFRSYPHLDRAYRLLDQGQVRGALAEYDAYLRLTPDDIPAHLARASLRFRLRDYQGTINDADAVLLRKPSHPGALLDRAMARQALEQFDEAYADAQSVMDDATASRSERRFAANLAADLAARGDRPEAELRALDRLVEFGEPRATGAEALVRRAEALARLDRRAEAVKILDRAAVATRDDARRQWIHRRRAELALQAGDLASHRESLASALALAPHDVGLMRALADIAWRENDFDDAARWLRRTIAVKPTSRDREFLADLLIRQGKYDAAIEQYERLIASGRSVRKHERWWTGRGFAAVAAGRTQVAVRSFRAAAAIRPAPDTLATLANALQAAGETDEALAVWRRLADDWESLDARERLGEGLAGRGDSRSAAAELARLADARESAALHLRTGNLYAHAGELEPAVRHLEQAARLGSGPDAQYALGVVLARAGDGPGAVRVLTSAVSSGLEGGERAGALRQIGFLQARAGRHDEAVDALGQAIAAGDGSLEVRTALGFELFALRRWADALEQFRATHDERNVDAWVRIGLCLKELGRSGEALEAFERASTLAVQLENPGARRGLWNDVAALRFALGRFDEAEAAWKRSMEIEPDPAVALRLFEVQNRSGRLEEANLSLSRALALNARPENDPAVVEDLAYALRRAGRLPEAARAFESVLAVRPARLDLLQDLAYTYRQAGDGDRAASTMRRAIDLRLAALAEAGPGAAEGDRKLYDMRSEVSRLDRPIEFSVFQTYRPGGGGGTSVAGASGGGVVPSQGGAEVAWRPPGSGSDNGRAWQLFARTLWASKTDGVAIDRDTVIGGVGLRVKPFASQDFNVAAERLIGIGDDTRSDWLLRATWGWASGYGLRFGEKSWNHTSLFADLGYFTRDGGTRVAFAEARQGRTFNFGNQWLLTPHVVLAARGQDPDPAKANFVEVGPGVSMRYLFGGSRYENPRSSADLSLQYRARVDGQRGSGWLWSAVFRF